MGALANALRAFIPQFWRSNGVGGLTSASDARTYQEHVADAIEQLEANGTASKWYEGSGAPAPALGQLYDQYLDNDTGDTWAYDGAQGWQRTGNLRGKDGRTPVKGVDYFDGRTPVKGVDYFDGRTPVKGVDYRDGVDGRTPVKGTDYFDGADGSQIYQGSAAPTAADPGKVGDKFYHWLSATQYALYDYPSALFPAGTSPWRLRFTTPAGGSGGGTGTVKSVSVNGGAPVSPDSAGNVALTVAGGGGSVTVDADLLTNPASATNAASVKAVNDVAGFLANLKTSVKTSLVAGINTLSDLVTSLRSDVGTLASLNTTAKGSVVAAINELAGLIPQIPVTRNVYDVDSQKKSDVVSANQARVIETQSAYYDREFYDSTTFTPLVYGFKCVPIAEQGATNWYWIRREIK